MKKLLKSLSILFVFTVSVVVAQTNQQNSYRAEKEKIHDIIHTKLKVDFNFAKKEMNGEEWITLKPHFYTTSKVTLDAKAMLFHQVMLGNKKLDYYNNKKQIIINLPREYNRKEQFTLYLKYTARPEKVTQKGSVAITNAKGLYFINADGTEKNKPTQIWTQGETESSSCWFPTIDSPNQKTSQEIYITVPKKYVTLSNGLLEKQTNNSNGTRTDYWNFKKKHAPYLFFMGIGEYEIIKDSYKNIPVNYYVEKEYALYAKDIFGLTPEMIGFFSRITGVEYQWSKYSQIVGRDYVSGAMENTTAVIHGEKANQKPGQLIDENLQENTIAHELFHHWFGNLVTTESWSNITVNESFANYSEYLWREYKYSKIDADAHMLADVEGYKNGKNFSKHLVRFNYTNKEDVFDAVSYNKGGAILHMLRKYVGDDAFFTGMKNYLTKHKFGTGEVHQWRLALEEVTGKDLNPFFNQWYFNSGHPKISISYDYNTLEKTVTVNLQQTQTDKFQFPIAIDIFENGERRRKEVFVKEKDASFTFSYQKMPNLILVNSDGVLLADFEEIKILSQYIYQLDHAKSYAHKKEALIEVAKHQDNKEAFNALANAMNNSYFKLRKFALENIDLINKYAKKYVIEKIKQIAKSDKRTLVRAAAIETLGKLTDPTLIPLFNRGLQSKSYSILGNSLVAMYYVDKATAIAKSKTLPDEIRKILATPLTRIYIEEKDEKEMNFIAKNVLSGMFLTKNNRTKTLYNKAFTMISKSNNTQAINNLTQDMIVKGNQYKQYNFDKMMVRLMKQMIQNQKEANISNKNKNITIIKTAMAQLIK